MTKAQYTLGPWKLHIGSDYICISNAKGEDIISDILWPVYDEREMANARLIAAAPELLEALEACEAYYAKNGGPRKQWDNAKAAIAKASGQ